MAGGGDTGGSPIVRFYRGEGADSRGRTLDEILQWDDDRLEAVHDYIQWVFPIDEPSRFNPDAPLLTGTDRLAFRQPALAANLRRALDRMLAFYGFTIDRTTVRPRILRSPRWGERSQQWLHAGNHNLLRLTRIIRSLALLGEVELATALYDALRQECEGRVSTVTIEYWKEATDGDA
jgi:Opioid growth factor receptor (OGFr) conserved region